MENAIDIIKRQLAQLKELNESGVLRQQQYEEGKSTLERRLLDLVLSGAGSPNVQPGAIHTDMGGAATVGAKPSGRLLSLLVGGILVVAAAGYWWKGAPDLAAISAPQSAGAASTDGTTPTPHATNFDQIAAMTEKLALRLKDQPNDAEGWAMLARSYSVLGKHPEALKAYEKAIDLRKDDATLLADYADSLAVKNNRNLNGEPMKQVERALKVDPRNLKALSLAGTHAFDKKDYAGAVKYWEQVVQFGANDNALVQQVQPGLTEARGLAGLPAATPSLDALKVSVSSANGSTVSGTVALSTALRKQVQPEDTVFVFARSADGSRMPLAILRSQVKDLPLQFKLDDSMAMSPANALSSASKVVVGARVSKSGNAMPQPGDLSGQSTVVTVGASGVQIEIKETVKP
jgi:cytochrome c-type biogenesis protein CcmH